MPAVSFALAHINTHKAPQGDDSTANHSPSRSPLSALKRASNSKNIVCNYHPQYHPFVNNSSPNKKPDLVLASSDENSTWFAVTRSDLFATSNNPEGPNLFKSVGLETLTPDYGLPLIKLGESRQVIEVILSCLQPDTIPDFGKIEFKVLVSALEAAADKYKLVHIEKICLLALSAYAKTHPVEVYTLATHYSCRFLAESASQYTMSLDITRPEYQDILTSENHAPLVKLYQHCIESAKSIVLSKQVSPHAMRSSGVACVHFCQLKAFWARARTEIACGINRPVVDFKELFAPWMEQAMEEFEHCGRCYGTVVRILDDVEREWKGVRKMIWAEEAEED